MSTTNRSFDPETLAILRDAFDEACDLLPPDQRTEEMRLVLAGRILTHAAKGERNPAQLRAYALTEVAAPTIGIREGN